MSASSAGRRLPTCQLWHALDQKVDVFICCGSFEDRSRTAAEAIASDAPRHVIVAENGNLKALVSANSERLRDRFGDRSVLAMIDSSDPLETSDGLAKALGRIPRDEPLKYLTDITTFTHESLLILLKLLSLHLGADDKLFFVYTNAAEYSVGDPDGDKWLSKGVVDVRSVLGYPGDYVPSRPSHLVILVGYEHERASGMIEVVEPDSISLGYGRPGTAVDPKHQGANKYFHDLVKKAAGIYGGQVCEFHFSCQDPWDAKRAVLERISRKSGHNALVAPMNTKISTIGAALAALEDESIRLCYAQPLQYNSERYSSPGSECYLFQVPELLRKG